MYQEAKPLQRIDQHVGIKQSELYEPLRRSLLRRNLSQSNISSRSNLSVSRVGDLCSSRVSRRLRSLSPQQMDQIRSNTFVPITKRLVPTRNLEVVRHKRFEAIDVEERVHKPIPAIRFNSINRFNINKVQQIVYQPEDCPNPPHYNRVYQPIRTSTNFQHNYCQTPNSLYYNVYTTPNSYATPGFNVKASQVREYSPRNAYNLGIDKRPTLETRPILDARPMLDTFGGRKSNVTPGPIQQQNYTTYDSHYVIQPATNLKAGVGSVLRNSNSNITTFENSPIFNPSTLPIVTSTGLQPQKSYLSDKPSTPNIYTSQCTPQIRQLPTQHTLSFLGSPFGSRTSFQPDIQKPQSSLNRSYDFSKITQDSSKSEYRQKKHIFDEPANTKCAKTGCFKNEIIATRPNVYEWQQ